ncbi:AEC family transporter [Bradyrhizobium sp. LHD-71]|uniref:AEC family transporter n=1 Tax=Bradyrhizobium sp. LHD-71 TaxID=3072141 RepID=UPI00280D2DA2|nr:AEC family transporter [Bradyrhizobium sp. LHD-71]MDQ8728902.1 AEC family transporter [Bradyrhizobium sp. LHD-71]
MIDVLNLSLPYFGLIFIGFACGKFRKLPETGLAWLNFFLLYIALPALFFRILAKTPFEELNNLPFVIATTCATASAFALAALLASAIRRGRVREAVMAGLAGGYGNIGYMGPGLALATFGPSAAVPVALIFCFDSIFLFSIVPLLMAVFERTRRPLLPTVINVARQIVFHPLIIASWLGTLAAAFHVEPPVALDRTLQFLQNAAAPVALFALGVTVALRPFDRVPWEVPAVVIVKLLAHPLLAVAMLSVLGPFDSQWVATALLMASLPPALNAFIIARQYDSWVEAASTAVLLGTMASVLTLTTIMWLLKTGRLGL